MDQHLRDPRHFIQDAGSHKVREIMSLPHGLRSVHNHVKLDIEAQPIFLTKHFSTPIPSATLQAARLTSVSICGRGDASNSSRNLARICLHALKE
jgi:hypothetical protein